jgi:hypothetical protein
MQEHAGGQAFRCIDGQSGGFDHALESNQVGCALPATLTICQVTAHFHVVARRRRKQTVLDILAVHFSLVWTAREAKTLHARVP